MMNDTEVAATSWSERELAQRIEADDTGALGGACSAGASFPVELVCLQNTYYRYG